MAQDFGARPSAFLGIEPYQWMAFQFDRAVSWFGRRTDARLEERWKNGKRKWTVEQALQDRPSTGLIEAWIGKGQMDV